MVIWPVHKILQTLLSPHNRAFCGLLTGGFKAPNLWENICLCCSSTTNHAPDPTISPMHSHTSVPLVLSSSQPSTTPPPGTSTTTTVPSPGTIPSTTSSTNPCPSPAPAHLEPLQAHFVVDTDMEDMDTNEQPPTHHTIYAHYGTNGLLTFPSNTAHLEHLPTATVSPQIRKEVMESSTDSSFDEMVWLEGIVEQEALEQQLEDLEELLTNAGLNDVEPLNTQPPTPPSLIDASNSVFTVTDVRLRQTPAPTSSIPTSTTTRTATTTTQPPMHTTRPSLIPPTSSGTASPSWDPQPSTSGMQGRSRPPQNSTPAPRTTTYRVRSSPSPRGPRRALLPTPALTTTTHRVRASPPSRSRRALLPTPAPAPMTTTNRVRASPPTRPRRVLLPTPPHFSAVRLFWWCEVTTCGRANPTYCTCCRFCGQAKMVARRRMRGQ